MKFRFMAGVMISLVFGGAAVALEPPDDYSDYTVTAARLPGYRMPLSRLGAAVTVIEREEIERSGVTSLPEILEKHAGFVTTNQSVNRLETLTSLRGFAAGGDLVVVVDGVRVNEPNGNTMHWNLIPVERIERVEIIRGGSTSLYGPHAFSGVIQIWTKKAEKTGGSVSVGYGSHARQNFQGTLGMVSGDWDVSLGTTLEKENGYRHNSDVLYADLSGELGYNRGSGRYSFSWQMHEDRLGRAGELTDTLKAQNRRQTRKTNDYADFEQNRVTLGLDHPLLGGALNARLSYRDRDRITRNTSVTFGPTSTTENVGSLNGVAEWSRSFGAHGISLLYDEKRDDAEIVGINMNTLLRTTNQNIEEVNRAGGLRLDLALGQSWTLTGTARYDRFKIDNLNRFDSTQNGSRKFEDWSPGASLVFHPDALGANGRAYFSASRTFRPPTASNLFGYFSGFSTPNPGLRPEKAKTLEAGLFLDRDRWDLGASVFRIKTQDEIAFDGVALTNRNVGITQRDGIEAYLGLNLIRNVTLSSELTWLDAEVKQNPTDPTQVNKSIPQVANFQSATTLRWDNRIFSAEVAHRYTGRRPLENDSNNSQPFLPAYGLFDIGLGYHPKPDIHITAKVTNVFDKDYSSRGADGFGNQAGNFFNPSPEREFYGSVSYDF